MGQVNRQGQQTSQVAENKFAEPQEITIDDILKAAKTNPSEALAIDLSEDAWEWGPPPPADRYKLKCFLGQKGYKRAFQDPKKPDNAKIYYTAELECRIQSDNPEYNNVVVYAYLSTRLGRGKSISTVMGWLVKVLGEGKIPKKDGYTHEDQIKMIDQVIKKEPIVEADVDWKAGYRLSNDEYQDAFRHMKDFPEVEGEPGKHHHIAEVTAKDGSTHEVRANLFISTWYAKGEASKERKVAAPPQQVVMPQQGGFVPQGAPQPVIVPQPVQQTIPMPVMVPQPVSQPVNAAPQVNAADVELLLD